MDIKQLSLFFSLFTKKNSENRLLLAPFLLAPFLLAPVPPCLQPCLPPPCPRSRKFSSGLQLRACPPSLTSVLTVHNPQPPFCLHFSCPYVSLSICAFWLSHFYSFTPSSLLSCPPIQYAYSCVLLFSPSFLSRLLMFMPLISRRQVTSQLQKKAITVHLSIMSGLSGLSGSSVPSPAAAATPRGERGGISVSPLS